MDGAILVVAATDEANGTDTRTRSTSSPGWCSAPVVALNKADMVDDEEMLELVEEVRDLLSSQGFPGDDAQLFAFQLKSSRRRSGMVIKG